MSTSDKRRLDEASRLHTSLTLPKIGRLRRRRDEPTASRRGPRQH
jgi:hypothetical protein